MSALPAKFINRSPLQELYDHLSREIEQVDQVILQSVENSVPLIANIAHHLIQAGGKRIRPLLTLASNKLFAPIDQCTIYLSAAVEFIHTATLLHDDVVDESELRRNQPAANTIWGNAASILVGDFLFARAFELMVQCQNLDILRVLSSTSAKIAAGEVLQLQYCQNFDITQDIALEIISAKTAELFAAACYSGSAMTGACQESQQALHDYGYYFGLIFQITDDILDYTSAHRGKIIGDDFREGKITLPVIFAYQNCSLEEQAFLRCLIQENNWHENDLHKIITLIETKGGFDHCYQLAQQFATQALKALEKVPQNLVSKLLIEMVYECLKREK
ncbi:MAG TPA: polyprenyl synthetase family protein [Candidatus Nitrosotenuis sp.]|nr:polyprenyl synthetase family protein [Candidatus Nitrosotenuis sp.]